MYLSHPGIGSAPKDGPCLQLQCMSGLWLQVMRLNAAGQQGHQSSHKSVVTVSAYHHIA